MAAKQTAKTREYRVFPRAVDNVPRSRHANAADADNLTTRERIARPLYARPRSRDWS
jgi:hypothetical protein